MGLKTAHPTHHQATAKPSPSARQSAAPPRESSPARALGASRVRPDVGDDPLDAWAPGPGAPGMFLKKRYHLVI